eukprot:12979983-Alexandrium_andersonii.AAC.1
MAGARARILQLFSMPHSCGNVTHGSEQLLRPMSYVATGVGHRECPSDPLAKASRLASRPSPRRP